MKLMTIETWQCRGLYKCYSMMLSSNRLHCGSSGIHPAWPSTFWAKSPQLLRISKNWEDFLVQITRMMRFCLANCIRPPMWNKMFREHVVGNYWHFLNKWDPSNIHVASTIVVKTGLSWPVWPIQSGTDHSLNLISRINPIAIKIQ